MKEEIIRYLIDEEHASPQSAKYEADIYAEYDDIAKEFVYWIRNRNYDYSPAVEIEGWTARRIHEENPKISASVVFMTLYWLHEDPDYTIQKLERNFATM